MSGSPRTITILGSTGSIGSQTLDILTRRGDDFRLNFITCNTRVDDLIAQVRRHEPRGVAIRDEEAWRSFRMQCPEFRGPVLLGEEGLCEAAAHSDNDIVMSAMVGFSGVVPTMAAIRTGVVIGLANKETLVSAGDVMTAAAREHGATLIAVDSEHSAILQCMAGERIADIEKFIITASGGPFRTFTHEQLADVTAEQALRHPNWTMGAKITIDSATLMNKGFEVIEARWLFDLAPEHIDVVIHPQSIIHSMVQFVDGSVKAQMGLPTMLVPIQYALTYPVRMPLDIPRMDLAAMSTLTFERPDVDRFPCLRIAYDVLKEGGTAACVANAANEIAVAAFLEGRCSFTGIASLIERTLADMESVAHPSLDDVVAVDAEARRRARIFLNI
ncbi:MAG: 1-deoxy-D-xylulose-5-phosphate reductoisomerase ['Candidatus Kapabacteria' thiocyanatum]|uniref:1-deoxy-D-xylulose 5-phosphate reductoisomerase n=1 Tax=Candidatus Kapaibacterium thiocyanatum TaxID=1895771 RepID=A0A1M3KXB1_9BACT|nr:1-deoxy-D-xylulose-5-phosphate reductoisomerase ['Candidatus Kapabacteria' thiocyanatum]OJX56869.1 MAG: 1-deoxy-D-xylulose-5-phosphate reductoisomerase ['Candidatus Kapabacteria' thiocyanatum]